MQLASISKEDLLKLFNELDNLELSDYELNLADFNLEDDYDGRVGVYKIPENYDLVVYCNLYNYDKFAWDIGGNYEHHIYHRVIAYSIYNTNEYTVLVCHKGYKCDNFQAIKMNTIKKRIGEIKDFDREIRLYKFYECSEAFEEKYKSILLDKALGILNNAKSKIKIHDDSYLKDELKKALLLQ